MTVVQQTDLESLATALLERVDGLVESNTKLQSEVHSLQADLQAAQARLTGTCFGQVGGDGRRHCPRNTQSAGGTSVVCPGTARGSPNVLRVANSGRQAVGSGRRHGVHCSRRACTCPRGRSIPSPVWLPI